MSNELKIGLTARKLIVLKGVGSSKTHLIKPTRSPHLLTVTSHNITNRALPPLACQRYILPKQVYSYTKRRQEKRDKQGWVVCNYLPSFVSTPVVMYASKVNYFHIYYLRPKNYTINFLKYNLTLRIFYKAFKL